MDLLIDMLCTVTLHRFVLRCACLSQLCLRMYVMLKENQDLSNFTFNYLSVSCLTLIKYLQLPSLFVKTPHNMETPPVTDGKQSNWRSVTKFSYEVDVFQTYLNLEILSQIISIFVDLFLLIIKLGKILL